MRKRPNVPSHCRLGEPARGRAPDSLTPFCDEDADACASFLVGRLTEGKVGPFDRQRYQPHYLEVLCEAEDLMARLARIADPYGVPVYSGAGFDGIKGKRAFAERAMERAVPTIVLNIGDADKHGGHIYTAAAEDAIAWGVGRGHAFEIGASIADVAAEGERSLGMPGLLFVRIALTVEQAEEFSILDADGKAEADAVPVPVMDGWLRAAIEELLDEDARRRLLDEERSEQQRPPAAIRTALTGLELK